MVDASSLHRILDGNAKPDMFRYSVSAISVVDVTTHERTALGEHLIDVPVSYLHRVGNLVDEATIRGLVKRSLIELTKIIRGFFHCEGW